MNQADKKTAVITGATGGIGREIAICLLKSGFSVYLLGRNFESLQSTPVITEGVKNKTAYFCRVDLSDEDELLETVELINQEDKIDFLIHGAAYYTYGNLEDADIADLDRSYEINVRAPYLLSRQLLPKLKAGKGVIIFLNSSVISEPAKENLTQYASTKSALKTMADGLRQEVNRVGIRVVTIILGKTATRMQQKACEYEGMPYQPEKMIQPDDLAELIFRVASSPANMEITDLYVRPSVSYGID